MALSRGVVITGFALAWAAGFATGYLYTNGRLAAKYDDKLAEELAAAQHVYKIVKQREDFATPEEAAMVYAARENYVKEGGKRVEELIGTYGGPKPGVVSTMEQQPPAAFERTREWRPGVVPGAVPPERKNNIFDDAKTAEVDFDYATEERNRTEEAPYIISQHEHGENSGEFNQVTLTYYEGDGVLCDERDDKIDDIDEMVGSDNIVRFGHRSGDNNVLYVRNHRFGLEMEIVRDQRKFSEVVLGLTAGD